MIAVMMEAVQTSQTLVNSYQSTRRYNPEDSHLCFESCNIAVSLIAQQIFQDEYILKSSKTAEKCMNYIKCIKPKLKMSFIRL
jgi:hypothetical protein